MSRWFISLEIRPIEIQNRQYFIFSNRNRNAEQWILHEGNHWEKHFRGQLQSQKKGSSPSAGRILNFLVSWYRKFSTLHGPCTLQRECQFWDYTQDLRSFTAWKVFLDKNRFSGFIFLNLISAKIHPFSRDIF